MWQVGPTIFLGRGFFWLDGEDLKPKYATGIEKAAVDALQPLTNATITAILNAQKVVRRVRNLSKYTDISYPPVYACACLICACVCICVCVCNPECEPVFACVCMYVCN